MSRYLYSIVRCLPEPRTGEFANFGAIAGDPVTGDWATRRLGNLDRVRRFLGEPALQAAARFMGDVDEQIGRRLAAAGRGGDPLGEGWLQGLHRDFRNLVQLSPPCPISAESAEDAVAAVFVRFIVDPGEGPECSPWRDHDDPWDAGGGAGVPARRLSPTTRPSRGVSVDHQAVSNICSNR